MYAVIESGGKQYRVEVGTELEVELLEAEPGQSITLERVLLVADGDETAIGRPVVENAAVEAEVVRRDRADKVIVFKYRPKARRRVKKGHRQELTVLRITDVRLGSKSAAESVKKAERDAKSERQRLEEAAAKQAAADAALAAKLAKPAKASDAADAPKKAPAKAAAKPKAKASGDDAAADTERKPRTRAKAETKETSTDAAPKRSRTKKDE
jgi:large subunit ribosomal protein L21